MAQSLYRRYTLRQQRIYLLIFLLIASYIQAHVPVVVSQLTEVGDNFGFEIQWPPEITLRVIFICCLTLPE
jgi:hypothetical protein